MQPGERGQGWLAGAVVEGQELELGGIYTVSDSLASFSNNHTQDSLSSYHMLACISSIPVNYLVLFLQEPFEVADSI